MSAGSAQDREPIPGWNELRHAGLLLDGPRLHSLAHLAPGRLDEHVEGRLRRRAAAVLAGVDGDAATVGVSEFVSFVFEEVCGFSSDSGDWLRGSRIPASWGRRTVTGDTVKPRHVWTGPHGVSLPIFIDDAARIGVGRGRRAVGRVLGWLRAGSEHLALVTNGRQWRLVFAGLDYDASCEWDAELWFEEGGLAPQVTALRTLLRPELWTPAEEGVAPQLLQAIRETRKGQADLSEVLGERLREAVEILVRSHGEALKELADGDDGVAPADIYRAACRVAMRAVVILFAESRDLLPRSNTVYHEGYGLNGLFDQLERRGARGDAMRDAFGAWPRVLSLFRLVSEGSHHPDLPVTAYGGELFAPGHGDARDGVSRALHVFETACFRGDVLADRDVYAMLRLLTRTKARIRQGRGGMWVTVPVDFSDLSSEYIGIVYEGLLDYELKTAPDGDPVVFLAVGDRPALPLSRLEEMDDRALRDLFEKLRKGAADDEPETDEGEALQSDEAPTVEDVSDETGPPGDDADMRRSNRTRAETWARRAAEVAGLVRKPRGRLTPERRLAHERKVGETARKLVREVVLPGEWYLARWGGTRKGSGSFYTRPGLAVPIVHRALRPLAYDAPSDLAPEEARHAPPVEWTPKLPEDILALTVCDPACGSGSFVLAALRFLTGALYESLQFHARIERDGERSLVRILGIRGGEGDDPERLSDEQIPCAPDHEDFEPRLKACLRRHVVERCLYAVDLDPLAVELCRISLWIETMDRELPFGFLDHKVKCGNALIGAWFDQFQHYPVMAWKNREGGDKTHSNGVHFEKNARGKAIKAFHRDRLTPDMNRFLEGATLFQEDQLEKAATVHDDAIEVLAYMHDLPIHDASERADVYRKELLGSTAWRSLKEAMDLWCACWFWPADDIEHAPLPTSFADLPRETRTVAKEVAARHRFFHWELEFPDVFDEEGAGFDAIVGNPPWDIAKPVSMEFFSNIDPLYRSYGKQEALRKQTEYFGDEAVERGWLDYCADFRAQSNFVGRARNPFGDPEKTEKSQNRLFLGKGNLEKHRRWRNARRGSTGFVDPKHPFRHQGSADLNLYKLFLEAAHALARKGGRIGFLVPSGLYSDNGTGALRTLFLESCRWKWLFGIENRAKIFPIDSRAKFNPVIIEKGGTTEAIQTAFMRRSLDD
ncbi:Eco57I restriction-modification methylase domain-containing protein [Candidatus Palauibacter sp.]|uniref:Eco57I restriction-modification methylase domain-containing protein n=1 Tax=Candidatus Palauibacter sp. TaxID=3101350 RepID=UPI003B01599C